MTTKEYLISLIKKGIEFDSNQGKLLVKGALQILTDADKKFLKEHKSELLTLIDQGRKSKKKTVIPKSNSTENLPLSYRQESLWLLDKINNGSAHYNLLWSFRIRGNLNYDALIEAFLTIIQRHEILRTNFLTQSDGNPIQKVNSINRFAVPIEILDSSDKQIEDDIRQKILAESTKVFDLENDLLIRVRLLKLDDEEHVLIIALHHIIADEWSIGILLEEFKALYEASLQQKTDPLPELQIQYGDYASWQRKELIGERLDHYLSYWKNQLSDLPLVHNLPLDFTRPNMQTFKGDILHSTVTQKTLNALKELCKSQSASLFMGMYSAFNCLLARYSGEKDIVIGSPIANREREELSGMVGFFMNLLVLRSDLTNNPSFKDLIRQSKGLLQDAYQYQQLPFDKLIEELKVPRNLSHNPLFQVLISMYEKDIETISFSGLTLDPVENDHDNLVKYDLCLHIAQSDEGLHLTWEYNSDLFKRSTIDRMARNFGTLLNNLLELPDEDVFKIELLDAEEKQSILSKLIGENIDISKKKSVIDLLEYNVKTNTSNTAVICDGQSYTFEEFDNRANAICNLLIEKGIQKQDKVGICLLRGVDMVATIFACLKIGAIYIPLDPIYPAERIKHIVDQVSPQFIVCTNALKALRLDLNKEGEIICLDDYRLESFALDDNFRARNAEYIAYIIFTSGTTGKPKGIEITHTNLDNLLHAFDKDFGSDEVQRWLAQTSINFDISVLELIWTISRGHTIVLQKSNPLKLLDHSILGEARKMDFSVMFFGADKAKERKYDLLLNVAKYADENGFKSIWTPERHFGEFGGAYPSPPVLSSALAVLTKNLGIQSGSVVLPLHDPIRVAEEWSLIDNLSNGRVGLSIASGWQPDDFVINNSDFKNRHQTMREGIVELKKLWSGEPITRKNGLGNDFAINIRPKPIQKELPLWITAAGNPATFKYAGQIGANLLTHMLGQSIDTLEENIGIYNKSLEEHGFDPNEKSVTLMLHTYLDETLEQALKVSEQPFKEYLGSSIRLMKPMADELGIDMDTQLDELIEMAFLKFSKENTLIGSPASCQPMLFNLNRIGVTEVACLVDFGVEAENVMTSLQRVVEANELYQAQSSLVNGLNVTQQLTEADLIETYNISHVQMTPSQARLVYDIVSQRKSPEMLETVQKWFIGGEPLNKKLLKDLDTITTCKFYNMYGPTETTVWSAWQEVNKDDISIGGPILNTSLLLVDEYKNLLPPGIVGQLHIGGDGVGNGYFNNAELTNEKFLQSKNLVKDHARIYDTGDLMKLNDDGTFEFQGRKDKQVKINGYRVEIDEIESTIQNNQGVKDCRVIKSTLGNVDMLSAYVVKEDVFYGEINGTLEEASVKEFTFGDNSLIYHHTDRQLAMLYQEVIKDEIYFRHGISIPENGLVIDLGANVGTFSIDVHQRHPSAYVIALEPIPQIFAALKKNFEHRSIRGKILNLGISNKVEETSFFYYPEMAGMSGRFADSETILSAVDGYVQNDVAVIKEARSVEKENGNGADTALLEKENFPEGYQTYLNTLYAAEEVHCHLTTVSDLIELFDIETIDLLKLDVEKSELLALEGIRDADWTKIRQLVIEIDGNDNLEKIKNMLDERGYQFTVDDFVLADAEAQSEHNTYMLYATNADYESVENEKTFEKLNPQTSESELRENLKEVLPDYMVPKDFHFVDAIPLMENGKVDFVKLGEMTKIQSKPRAVKKLTNKTEISIYNIWSEVLNRKDIPGDISIFEAGGNSLEIVQIHERLQSAFNVEFPLVDLFRNATITQQAKLVNQSDDRNNTSKKALERGQLRRKSKLKKAKI
ncbi:MAG: MupA/Atu3671 family FMN-dependent luciferase-like monooxygenase [Bacteroidota bacterium]